MSGVDGYVQGPVDGVGKKIDNDVLTIGADQVYRQRARMAGAAAAELADVRNADPAAGDYGIVARIVGAVPLSTGAATEAKQDTEIAGLATIAANQTTELSSLASLVAKDYATQVTLAAFFAALGLAQGTTMTGATGPLVQGVVSDTPETFITGEVRPVSLTQDGRLRASVVEARIFLDFFPESECGRVNPDDYNRLWAMNDSPWSL